MSGWNEHEGGWPGHGDANGGVTNGGVTNGGVTNGRGGCPYGLCDGSGFVVEEETNTASDCRCRPSRIARLRAAKLEARIPSRFRSLSFEQLEGDQFAATPEPLRIVRRYVARLDENLASGRSVWIEGDVGTGKTSLAMMISKAALDRNHTVAIYSMPRLLGVIRASIEQEKGLVRFLDLLSSVELLHIDDLGAENKTDWALEQLYSIVNTRYEEQRSIVITTNLEPHDLEKQIGERTVSRLVEMCGDDLHLPLFGEDRRKELPLPERLS